MGKNRTLGAPLEIQVVAKDTQTAWPTDVYLVNTTVGPITITLDPNPTEGDKYVITDGANDAGTNNVTIVGGGHPILHRVSTALTTNGASITVVFSTSLGGWSVVGGAGGSSPVQTAWYLDPANSTGHASDANPGTASLPILTTAPLEQAGSAWQTLLEDIDIYLLSEFPIGAPTWFLSATTGSNVRLWIHGQQIVLHSGKLSASGGSVPNAGGGGLLMTVTDNAGLDWTPFIGDYFKVTSGLKAGYIAPIRTANGGGQAAVGALGPDDPTNQNYSSFITLVGNETYEIVRPTKVPSVQWYVNGPYAGLSPSNQGYFIVTDCEIKDDLDNVSVIGGTAQIQLAGCVVGSLSWDGEVNGITGVNIIWPTGSIHFIDGLLSTVGGVLFGATINLEAGASFTVDDLGLEANSVIAVDVHATLDMLTCNAFRCDIPFIVQGSLRFLQSGHFLWGSGNTTTTLSLSATGVFTAGTMSTINIVNTSGCDFTLDDVTVTTTSDYWKRDGTVAAGPTANTWANFALSNAMGGFQGLVMTPNAGGKLITSVTV